MTKIKDYRIKPLQKFYRPYFSPHTDSYEIDYVFGGKINMTNEETGEKEIVNQYYFACININSKYLFMIPLPMGENRKLINTFNAVSRIKDLIEAMNPEATIKHIRGDADSAFGRIVRFEDVENKKFNVNLGPETYRPNIFTSYLKDNNIELFLSPSQYTNKNRVIDRVIRTIRDKIGENPNLIFDLKIVSKVVE
jgi:hypothetical protein